MLGGNEAFGLIVAATNGHAGGASTGSSTTRGAASFPSTTFGERADSPYVDWFTIYGTPVNAYDLSVPPATRPGGGCTLPS